MRLVLPDYAVFVKPSRLLELAARTREWRREGRAMGPQLHIAAPLAARAGPLEDR
jgi:hypothetical protein